jgi:hypothetical protein
MSRYALATFASLLIVIAPALQFASVEQVLELAGYTGLQVEIDYDFEGDGVPLSRVVSFVWFNVTVADRGGVKGISLQKSQWSR